MFVVKVVVAYLCFYSVHCKCNCLSKEEEANSGVEYNQESSENKVIWKEQKKSLRKAQENGNLNSTIEPSDYEYQESKEYREVAKESDTHNTLSDYRYAASIQRQGSHYANGALVDKRWVLSSAGEFYTVQESLKLFRVRLGSVDCKRGGILFPIQLVAIHPSFVRGRPSFDLALIRLAVPVKLTVTDSVHPIPLSKLDGTVVSAKFMTIYWPRIIIWRRVLPAVAKERVNFTKMRVSIQELIPSIDCAQMVDKLDKGSLCLKPLVMYHSDCSPDAGAPVVAKDGLWGITSGWVSPNCSSQPGPTMFTRVSLDKVRSWIDAQLREYQLEKQD